jgi:hypothetical protein
MPRALKVRGLDNVRIHVAFSLIAMLIAVRNIFDSSIINLGYKLRQAT